MALFVLGDTHLSLGGSKPMDVFPGWNGYVERLEANWRKLVKPEDTIVLAGDISWAMRLTDTRRDFEFLQQLPGQKLIMKGEAIITTEVGQNQMWAAQFYKYHKPRTYLTSGGLGTMGYGLPAAIGAQMAFPDRLVVDVAGDGSIQMNIQELMTAVENGLPVKILILNNRHLGMVRQWQELFYDANYVATDMKGQPDFVKLADAYGAEGYRITTEEELEELLPKALASPRTAVIDVLVDREENVSPIVPAGASLDEMLIV